MLVRLRERLELVDFIIRQVGDRLEAVDPPMVGDHSMFSLELLSEANRGIGVGEATGCLIVLGMTFEPVGFDSGGNEFGPPLSIICRRVT
jgi:hypothetical protein